MRLWIQSKSLYISFSAAVYGIQPAVSLAVKDIPIELNIEKRKQLIFHL